MNMDTKKTPYEQLGGEIVIKQLVARFYELMDTLPEAYGIRQLHPKSLQGSEEKLFMFLSGWLGGPQLYIEKYGHPRLRRRHFPFEITTIESEQWMLCMRQALQEQVADETLRTLLTKQLTQTANHMINK